MSDWDCMDKEPRPLKKVDLIMLFANGSIAAFIDGEQVAPLQEKTAIAMLGERAESLGYDIVGAELRTQHPSAESGTIIKRGWQYAVGPRQ